ncbi:hypothetical protein ASG52_23935 [Methylobacterium sp. Leaf456]|uniref:hypothetical protein n=1 Tax=Methylobacterium sp. Leaf456 TaxID=1736382 RepID=UPI000700C506|nr:hypothetical protein [Methylobacterium sp. Leaf456]KQT56240.1 hypothetical protein ASG52_23935 [Methylobacterium sp. Leaf456]
MTPRLLLAALGLAALTVPALAQDGPPKLDVESTCKSAQRAQVSISDNASLEGCLQSERSAQDELKKNWSKFPGAAKTQCSQQFTAGGSPSYVELVTCLELASGTAPSQGQDGGAQSPVGGGKAPSERKTGSTLTKEPSPAQRTDPIKVLNDK